MADGERPVADAAMRLKDLCTKCKADDVTHVWINLKPAGRILAQVRVFLESVAGGSAAATDAQHAAKSPAGSGE